MTFFLLNYAYCDSFFLVAALAVALSALHLVSLLVTIERRFILMSALCFFILALVYALINFYYGYFGVWHYSAITAAFWSWPGLFDFFQVLVVVALLFVFASIIVQLGVLPLTFNNDIFFLIAYSSLGVLLLLVADDLIMIYLGMELVSLTSYVLVAGERSKPKSVEAGIKYFVLGSLASLLFLSGVGLIYVLTGTTTMSELFWLFEFHRNSIGYADFTLWVYMFLAVVFLFSGVFFKISAFPFHAWTLDVYTGAPYVVLLYLALVGKLPFFFLILKLFWKLAVVLGVFGLWWIVPVGMGSMFVGSFGALYQFNLKRFLAYMTVGHTGYLLLFFASGLFSAFAGFVVYLVIYYMLLIGFFAAIFSLRGVGFNFRELFGDLLTLVRVAPALAFGLVLILLSMGGVPPLAGFYSKLLLLQGLVSVKFYLVAFFVVVVSVVNMFVYLRLVKIITFEGAGVFVQNYTFVHVGSSILGVVFVIVLVFNLLLNAGIGDGLTLFLMNLFLRSV